MAADQGKVKLSIKELELVKKLESQIDQIKIRGQELPEETKANLKAVLKDFYREVPAVLPHLYVLFKDCVDKVEGERTISPYVLHPELIKINDIIKRAHAITSKDLVGRDRDWYAVEFCEDLDKVNPRQVGIGKIYVNRNGDYRVYESSKKEKSTVTEVHRDALLAPAAREWKEYLKQPQHQANVREAVLNVPVFQVGPLAVSDKLPSRIRVAAKIEEYSKIVEPNNIENIKPAVEALNLLRRLCQLPLCVEPERVLSTIEENKNKLAAAEEQLEMLKKKVKSTFDISDEGIFNNSFPEFGDINRQIEHYSTELTQLENHLLTLTTGSMADAITLEQVAVLSPKIANLLQHIDNIDIDILPFQKLNKAVSHLSKETAPTPAQQIKLGALKRRFTTIQQKLIPAMNKDMLSKIGRLAIPYNLHAFERMIAKLTNLLDLENQLDKALTGDLNALSDYYLPESTIKLDNARIMRMLPLFRGLKKDTIQQVLEYFLGCAHLGQLDEDTIREILVLIPQLFENEILSDSNLANIEKVVTKIKEKLEAKVKHINADMGVKPFDEADLDDSNRMSKKRKKKAKASAGDDEADADDDAEADEHRAKAGVEKDTSSKSSKWDLTRLFEDGEDSIPVLNGVQPVHNPLAPIVPAPGANAAWVDVKGLSPLYHALRKLHLLLNQADGYKEISIPRLRQYLEVLNKISNNPDLTVRGKLLWKTLNPDGAAFKADQLLEKQSNGKNILEEAIEKHTNQYLPQFKAQLSVEGNKYEVGKCFYIEKTGGILYLMRKDGTNPSTEELQDAFAKYQVICQDMQGSVEAKIYICNDAFTQKPENQEKIAAIVNCLDLNLATDDTIPEQNKAIQKAVQALSENMKDRPLSSAEREVADENTLTPEILQHYRVTLTDGHCLLPERQLLDERERVQYLNTVYEWEQRCKYLGPVRILNDVLPKTEKNSYRKEKTLVYLDLLSEQTVIKLEEEREKRTKERELRCLEERQIQEAIRRSLQPVAKDANDIEQLKEDEDLKRALWDSLQTFELQQQQMQHLEKKHQFTIKDVRGDGNCFYRAVADQMEQQGISRFKKKDEKLYQSLRRLVQGRDYKNGEWAGVHQLLTLVQKTHAAIAVMDTRYPELGFRCYFINKQGMLAETHNPTEFEKNAADHRTIIRLAYTGNHYMSVTQHGKLSKGALEKAFNIADERQQLQSDSTSTVQRPQSRSDVVSERQPTFLPPVSTEPVEHRQSQASSTIGSKSQGLISEKELATNTLSNKQNGNGVPTPESTVRLSSIATATQAFFTQKKSSDPSTTATPGCREQARNSNPPVSLSLHLGVN